MKVEEEMNRAVRSTGALRLPLSAISFGGIA